MQACSWAPCGLRIGLTGLSKDLRARSNMMIWPHAMSAGLWAQVLMLNLLCARVQLPQVKRARLEQATKQEYARR